MSVIYVLLPVALILAGVAVYAFIRAARSGQFDDLETPAHRILHDDDHDDHDDHHHDEEDENEDEAHRTGGGGNRSATRADPKRRGGPEDPQNADDPEDPEDP